MTASYLGYNAFTDWSAATPLLTWATIPAQLAPTISARGIKTMFYTDPNRQAVGDTMYGDDSATFEHTCDGQRIVTTALGQDVMRIHGPDMLALWKTLVASRVAYGHIDAIFEDNAGGLDEYGTSSFSGMPCFYNDSYRLADEKIMETGLGKPVVYNALGGLNGQGVSTSITLNSSTIGGMFEHCYAQTDTKPKVFDWVWRATENTEIQMANERKLFFCMTADRRDAASATDGRQYVYASFLLTYDIGSSILWSGHTSSSGFNVAPETQLVALNPIVPTPSDISGLKTASGLYGREYGACYLKGLPLGPCAFVVNPDYYNSHAFPYVKYHHSLVLSGGAILDGGSVSVSGSAPPAAVPPLGSSIAFL